MRDLLQRDRWRLALSLVRFHPFDTRTPEGRSNERYRRIAITTISSLLVRGVGTLVGLVTVPLVLNYLGKEQFGLWSTITTLLAWVALFDFGLANGLVNVLSRAYGRDDRDDAARLVSTAIIVLLAIAALLAFAVFLSAAYIPWHEVLAVRGAVAPATVKWSVVAALTMFVISIPFSPVAQILAAYQRAYVGNVFAMAGVLCSFAALLIALRGAPGLPALIVVFGLGSMVTSWAGAVYVARQLPWLRFRWSGVSVTALRALMSRSVPLFLFQVGALAVNEVQPIILAHRCDLATVAEYAILMRLYVLAMGLIQVSTSSAVPSLREAHERGDGAWAKRAFGHLVRVRMALAVVAGVLLIAGGNLLLRVWLGRADVQFDFPVWVATGVLMLAATWATAHAELLAIMDRLWLPVALVLINAVVTITLTYALAPHLRVFGALLASAAVSVFLLTWLLPSLTRPVLQAEK